MAFETIANAVYKYYRYVFRAPIIIHIIIYRRLTNCRPNRLHRVQQVGTIIIIIIILLSCVFKSCAIVLSFRNLTRRVDRINAACTGEEEGVLDIFYALGGDFFICRRRFFLRTRLDGLKYRH